MMKDSVLVVKSQVVNRVIIIVKDFIILDHAFKIYH